MKNKLFFGAMLALLVAALGCSSLKSRNEEQLEADSIGARALQAVQNKYAPDRRLAIFNISATEQGDYLIMKGEVDNPEAKRELIDTLTRLGVKAVDRIEVLPSAALGDKIWGIVRVSVGNVRDERGNGAELGTQILMGHPVKLWKKDGGWNLVQSSDRYIGWLDDDAVVPCTKEELNTWNSTKRLIVTVYEGRIWQEPKTGAIPVSDTVAGVLLKNLGKEGDWYKVELPDGRTGYLAANAAEDYEEWRKSRQATAANIERTAFSMLGSPYLWGGTSTKGMDCSGFTKLTYFLNGIQLNRNASHQLWQGVEVPLDADLSQLKKGDLLFFGSRTADGRPGRIVHVGIYLGGKKFIHSSGMVKVNSLDPKSSLLDERRLKTLVAARRILTE